MGYTELIVIERSSGETYGRGDEVVVSDHKSALCQLLLASNFKFF